jgi:hypothetical protein
MEKKVPAVDVFLGEFLPVGNFGQIKFYFQCGDKMNIFLITRFYTSSQTIWKDAEMFLLSYIKVIQMDI